MSSLDSFFIAVALPTMREVASALIASLNNEHPSAHEVRAIVCKETALTANLLRLGEVLIGQGLQRSHGPLREQAYNLEYRTK